MKSILTVIGATAISAVLALPASAEVTIRYAHVGAEGEGQTRFAEELAERIEERTEGRVKVDVFPNSQLGNLSEMLDAVRVGAVQMAHHDFSSLDRYYEDVAVFNAPFAYRSADHAVRATAPGSPVLDEINESLIENAGIRIVGNFYRGARHLTARYPVYSPADMEGKKFRGVPIQLWSTMLAGMGAIPTPVEISEIMPALMTGLVEGQENPLNNIIARKMYEANKYLMMTGHMESVLAVFVNEGAWEVIPDEDRAIIEEILAELGTESLEWYRNSEADELEFLKEQGVTVIDEAGGLKLDEFRESVRAEVNKDYPQWADYLKRIDEIQ